MATKRMLVDASHPEETRVVVIDGNRLEDCDVEVSSRRQLKGNIYLAKVTRVEPSLQAAFVDYGGNRHGFLAFSEIHPDYYQIPVADREALLAEEAALQAEDLADGENGENVTDEAALDDDDDIERRQPRISPRRYKIQEVIKRRQVMLVQVVKEERGNKGAALTTYLSLAGRCCVLMPNTSRGGGISRKINNVVDRRRLKKILNELEVPQGMGVIVRTAGAGRSKAEIRRDYDYLLRLWASIRAITLESMAPELVYEEGNLIKRSIRDLYGRDIEEIIVQGEPQYRSAKEFMKLLIPSHAKRVKLYEDTAIPLFQHYGVEAQLESMHEMTVQLRSGGYLVINPTEALVSIDVNSGRATRERHIEETALRTNLEAADEIARHLRLRDLAGLIVVDFIDMESPRNQSQVERRLKEAMKSDKARVQIGRISMFGLLELSRQRLRPSVLETSFEICPHCTGRGMRRTSESAALAILRKIEEEGIQQRTSELAVSVPSAVAFYLLNHKRRTISAIEDRYRLSVALVADDTLTSPNDYRLERLKVSVSSTEEMTDEAADAGAEGEELEESAADKEGTSKRSRRRRPRRRRRAGDEKDASIDAVTEPENGTAGGMVSAQDLAAATDEDDANGSEQEAVGDEGDETPPKRRRRGKRGGRRRGRKPASGDVEAQEFLDEDAMPTQLADGSPVSDIGADISAQNGANNDASESADEAWDQIDTPEHLPLFTPEISQSAADQANGPMQDGHERTTSSEPVMASIEPGSSQPPPLEDATEDTSAQISHHVGGNAAVGVEETGDAEHASQQGEAVTEAATERVNTGSDAELIRTNTEEDASAGVHGRAQEAFVGGSAAPTAENPAEPQQTELDETRRSATIQVGKNEPPADTDEPRRGWWQRLLD